ncbi:phage tail tube protein [Pelosinus sp. UFO1]|uniref:phage tail tube protein n=1 Tax=Pelosinus sp. UFO1 TaxID=484770 RepID=UPI0004D15BE4|nr:phage tail tube protein [Pelosinus sp. UFO1]AIF52003.1 hypothetical protein UFO1_2456 [Pelosinus sp. UFO1]
MTQAQGYRGQLAMDFETTYNTTPAVPNGILMPIQSSKVKSKQNLSEDKTITGRRDPAQPSMGFIDVSGSIAVPVDELGIGYWLKAIFGDPVTTGASEPYTHVFKPGLSQPSLVLEQAFPDIGQYFLFNGCKVGKFGISFGGDGDLTANIDVMGAKETISNASFDTTLTPIPLTKFGNFQASITDNGVSLAVVTKADLNLDMGLDGDTYVLGSGGFRGSVNEGIIGVSGNVTALFTDATLLNKAMAGTTSKIALKLTNGTHSLEFKIPELMYERNSPTIDGPKGVVVELSFKGFYRNSVENAVIVVTLVNGQATY